MTETQTYPWYCSVDAMTTLEQGDLIRSCPVFVPAYSAGVPSGESNGQVIQYDIVIMSQTCDIVNDKLEFILVCPFFSLDEYSAINDTFKHDKGKEQLRKGLYVGLHLLNACDFAGYNGQFLVVRFQDAFSVPRDYLTNFAKAYGQRVRLLPPYREHLSQAFARFFMRVGLPSDIPPFKR